jgi:antitoxin ParD1/3/4
MPTRNVVLTEYQAKLVEKLVSSGRYQNASEVLRAGLRLIEERAAEEKVKLKALRAAIQVGIDDLENGRYVEFKTRGELRKYLKETGDEAIRRARPKAAAE